MGKPAVSINYFLSKVECYTNLFPTLAMKSKVAKFLIFNLEFFHVLPVSFETSPTLPEFTASFLYLHVGTILTE